MKRIGHYIFNFLTVLSLMLFAAAAAIWVDHRVRTEPGTLIRPCMELEINLLDTVSQRVEPRTVDLSGQIELPLLGKMKAGGLTCAQFETEINHAYKEAGQTASAHVSVRIVGFQPPDARVMSLLLTIPTLRVLGCCWSSWRTRRRLRAGLCQYCGYDLRATPDRCPECGQVPMEAET
jgi:hypothetical protein